MDMINNIFVTFIIAIKNDSQKLDNTIQSIVNQINQSYSNIEILVIDCNSLDNPFDIISKYAREVNIRFISEYDSGIYNAWNKAIKLSKGRWITFFGAGDLLMPNALSTLENFSLDVDNDCYVISSKSIIEYKNGNRRVAGDFFIQEKFERLFTTNHAGLLYRSNIFNKFGNFNERYKTAADYEFLLRVGRFIKFGYLDFIVSLYPYGGISSNSINPLKEAYHIRSKLSNISTIENFYLLLYGICSHIIRR